MQMKLTTTLECVKCKQKKVRDDPDDCRILQVEVQHQEAETMSIERLVQRSMEAEVLDADNKVYCENCSVRTVRFNGCFADSNGTVR